jgi:hypothetical protein
MSLPSALNSYDTHLQSRCASSESPLRWRSRGRGRGTRPRHARRAPRLPIRPRRPQLWERSPIGDRNKTVGCNGRGCGRYFPAHSAGGAPGFHSLVTPPPANTKSPRATDNQVAVQKQNGETTDYSYDPAGRTEKTVSEGSTKKRPSSTITPDPAKRSRGLAKKRQRMRRRRIRQLHAGKTSRTRRKLRTRVRD